MHSNRMHLFAMVNIIACFTLAFCSSKSSSYEAIVGDIPLSEDDFCAMLILPKDGLNDQFFSIARKSIIDLMREQKGAIRARLLQDQMKLLENSTVNPYFNLQSTAILDGIDRAQKGLEELIVISSKESTTKAKCLNRKASAFHNPFPQLKIINFAISKPSMEQLISACGPNTLSDDQSLDILSAYFDHPEMPNVDGALNSSGLTCLHWAALAGKVKVIDYLRNKGANVNQTDGSGFVPLHYAVISNKVASVKALCKFPHLLVQDRTKDVISPLDCAIYFGGSKGKLVKLLLAFQAKSLPVLPENVTLDEVVEAIRVNTSTDERNMAIVTEYFDKSGNKMINHPINDNGRTLLHQAAINGKTDIVRILQTHGANPNVRDQKGYSVAYGCLWRNL